MRIVSEQEVELFATEIIETGKREKMREEEMLSELVTDLHISEFHAKQILRSHGIY